MSDKNRNKRLAKNTLLLYFRMLVTMAIGLYASRVVLNVLGVSDYGIYNVVGGFVSMLAFVSNTLSTGTQRFLSFEIGQNNYVQLKRVFGNALLIHFIICLALIIVAETVGLWFVAEKLNLPEGREQAARLVYHFSILTMVFSILQVPFMSVLIAREKMDMYAYMSIYEALAKLLVIVVITKCSVDKLSLYAFLILCAQVSSVLIYFIYCRRTFDECRTSFRFNKNILKEMLQFSGWSIIGMAASTFNGQGINILLNLFFNTVVNAARGISFQVNNIIMGFVRNFQTAASPQIIKLYAEGKKEEMSELVISCSRNSAYLLLIMLIPFYFTIKYILDIWLVTYPDETVVFLKIILLQSLIQCMAVPVVYATLASGKLKMPNITAGLTVLLAIPISYLLLRLGLSPVQILIFNILPWFGETFFDVYYAHKYTGLSIKNFYKYVYFKVVIVFLLSFGVSYLLTSWIEVNKFGYFVLSCSISFLVTVASIYYIGLDMDTKTIVKEKVRGIISKIS